MGELKLQLAKPDSPTRQLHSPTPRLISYHDNIQNKASRLNSNVKFLIIKYQCTLTACPLRGNVVLASGLLALKQIQMIWVTPTWGVRLKSLPRCDDPTTIQIIRWWVFLTLYLLHSVSWSELNLRSQLSSGYWYYRFCTKNEIRNRTQVQLSILSS